jgi:hypothetical protein
MLTALRARILAAACSSHGAVKVQRTPDTVDIAWITAQLSVLPERIDAVPPAATFEEQLPARGNRLRFWRQPGSSSLFPRVWAASEMLSRAPAATINATRRRNAVALWSCRTCAFQLFSLFIAALI